ASAASTPARSRPAWRAPSIGSCRSTGAVWLRFRRGGRRPGRQQKGDPVNLELNGKTALGAGGRWGSGRAIAFGLGAEGVRVAICARDKARLEQTAGEIKARTNAEVFVVPGDLSRLDEVDRVAATVRER